MNELRFHPDALADYRRALGIGAYYPRIARRFAVETDRLLHQIVASPDSFPAYGEGRRIARLHSMGYAFVFERVGEIVHVLVGAASTVVHEERSEDAWARHLRAESIGIPAVPAVLNREVFDATPDNLLCSALFSHQLMLYDTRDLLLREPKIPASRDLIGLLSDLDRQLSGGSPTGLVNNIILETESVDRLVQTLRRIGAARSAQLYVEATQVVLPDGISPLDQAKYENNIEECLAVLDAIVAPIAALPRIIEIANALRSEAKLRFSLMTRWCREHPEECLEAEETVLPILRQRSPPSDERGTLSG